jgi:hypothetical protein
LDFECCSAEISKPRKRNAQRHNVAKRQCTPPILGRIPVKEISGIVDVLELAASYYFFL